MPTGLTQSNLDNKKIKKEIEGLSERSKKSKLKLSDLLVPGIAIVALIILSVFVFVPMINQSTEFRRELQEVNEKLDTLDSLENKLNGMDDTQLLEDLVVSKDVIPKVLKVSDFVFYIDNLAQRKGLRTKEISAGDVSVGGSTTDIRGSLGVSGPLSYTGSYDSILEFLDEIQGYSPYLVTLKNISLKGGESTWTVDFDLSGYYIPQKNTALDFYMPFTPYTNFSSIIDILASRSSKLYED